MDVYGGFVGGAYFKIDTQQDVLEYSGEDKEDIEERDEAVDVLFHHLIIYNIILNIFFENINISINVML